jgi:hypothetical protein
VDEKVVESVEQVPEDSSWEDSDTTKVEEQKGSEGLLGGGLLRLDILPPLEKTTTTVESGDSEDYYGPSYGPQEGQAGETTRSSQGAPEQAEGEEAQQEGQQAQEGEAQQAGQQQGGGPLDQVQDTVGGLTGGLLGGQQQGGGPLDQVQDTVGGLTGGLLGGQQQGGKKKSGDDEEEEGEQQQGGGGGLLGKGLL